MKLSKSLLASLVVLLMFAFEARAEIVLLPVESWPGGDEVCSVTTILTIDSEGKAFEPNVGSGSEAYKISGSLSESGAWDKSFSLIVQGMASVNLKAGADLGSSLKASAIDLNNDGMLRVQGEVVEGNDKTEGFLLGMDTWELPPTLALQITRIYVRYVGNQDGITIVNRNDTNRSVTVGTLNTEAQIKIFAGRGWVDVKDLRMFVQGGTRDDEVASIYIKNGYVRIAGFRLDVVPLSDLSSDPTEAISKSSDSVSEKILFGFETLGLSGTATPSNSQIKAGDATEGHYALAGRCIDRDFSNWPSYKEAVYNPKWAGVIPSTQKMIKWLDPDVARFTPWLPNGAVFFSALHYERESICGDWSGYAFLRLDAKSDAVRALRIIIEDEEIEPPVVSIVELPKDEWVTVEVDLEEAVKERDLDLENIVNLTIAREDGFHYKGSTAGEILIDNLRLGKKESSPVLSKMVDPGGLALPDSYRHLSQPPGIKPLSVTPDRAALSKSAPIIVDMSDCFVDDEFVYIFKSMPKLASVSPVGFIGAFDNKRMILGCTLGNPSGLAIRPTQVVTKQTLDGGKTWDLVPFEPIYNPDHGSSHGSVIDDTGSCFLVSSLGCAGAGGWFPTPRVFGLRTFFSGENGWESALCLDYENQRTEGIFDTESRHCVSNGTCIRLKNGRMWASIGYIGRRGRIAVAAKYSDDNGATWHSWREGKLATVPGSTDMERLRYRTYHYQRHCITPYQDGIAVIWTAEGGVHWNRFDGKAWSGKETILPEGIQGPFTSGDFYAVTLGEKDVFVTSEYFPGILHWDGTEWKKELEQCVPQSPLSVSGDRLLAFSAEDNDEGLRLVCYRRGPSGEWDNGEVLATDEFPLSKRWKDGLYKRAIVAQPYSPPNFAPVAWATAEEIPIIKILRVPVE